MGFFGLYTFLLANKVYTGQWQQKAQLFQERREKKFDNLQKLYPNTRQRGYFNSIKREYHKAYESYLKHFQEVQFRQVKNNLRYVQQCSGLNQKEFCIICDISNNAIAKNDKNVPYCHTIRMHTYLKYLGIIRYWLPMVTLSDMFELDLQAIYPDLKNEYQNNRLKLGKSIRKKYTFKQ